MTQNGKKQFLKVSKFFLHNKVLDNCNRDEYMYF